jgi:hypothetical protein
MALRRAPTIRVIALATVLSFSACATTSTITTQPPGAKVYVQGLYSGLSPLTLKLRDGFIDGSTYRVRVEKSGYKPQEAGLGQDYSAGGIVLDALLLFPTLFLSAYLCALNCQRHHDHYDFVLEPEEPQAAAQPLKQ